MSYIKLIKLLYLADREALITLGRPITTDRYYAMDNGPVVSRILELIKENQKQESFWRTCISERSPSREVELLKSPGNDELSTAESNVLNEIFDEFGKWDRWDLVRYTHKLPEWDDPDGGRISISYRDILNAGSRTDVDIVAIESELAAIARVDEVFARP